MRFAGAVGASADRAPAVDGRETGVRAVGAGSCAAVVVTGGAAGATLEAGGAATEGEGACARIGVRRRSASANLCAAARVRTNPAEYTPSTAAELSAIRLLATFLLPPDRCLRIAWVGASEGERARGAPWGYYAGTGQSDYRLPVLQPARSPDNESSHMRVVFVLVVLVIFGAMFWSFARNALALKRDVDKGFEDFREGLADEAESTVDPLLRRDPEDVN
jgi:hypothetical protein